VRDVLNLFKLRIGVAIAIAALAGLAVERGSAPGGWQAAVLVLAVLVSSAAAGAFNQYVERGLDARMARTRNRPFVTGALPHHDVAHVEGVEPVPDVNPYNMADNLHPAGIDDGGRK